MKFEIRYQKKAIRDTQKLRRTDPQAYRKLQQLIGELENHPRTGTGHPEQLSGDRRGQWSRRISQKHRLVYTIHDDVVVVLVLAAYGHYGDK